ncbi:40S ribosomal protein S2 [Microtus ochrogaster]|uniref:Small ribosomal subunit protein uS5 n=1 Tax=Microtus ochrogaster TaxID=79684 RepID=A0A8J6GDZ8_MICOH|nr:40S ribosomal protein S2 [Microtus ochrogaster]
MTSVQREGPEDPGARIRMPWQFPQRIWQQSEGPKLWSRPWLRPRLRGSRRRIRGAIILAKLFIVPVRRGYWGNKIGKPHTVPFKVTGRCGSVLVRLIPAPRGTGIVSAPVPKKLLMMAGIDDCYTSARSCTATLGNFAKATFDAISKTYGYLTPDLWKETVFSKSPYQELTDHLVKTHTRGSVQRTQAPAVATT